MVYKHFLRFVQPIFLDCDVASFLCVSTKLMSRMDKCSSETEREEKWSKARMKAGRWLILLLVYYAHKEALKGSCVNFYLPLYVSFPLTLFGAPALLTQRSIRLLAAGSGVGLPRETWMDMGYVRTAAALRLFTWKRLCRFKRRVWNDRLRSKGGDLW